MTPQLSQAIKLLAMSNAELSVFIEEQIERNPLLDRAPEAPRSTGSAGIADISDISDNRIAPVSLAEHLRSQLAILPLEADLARAALHIIAALGPCGYLRDDVADMAEELTTKPTRIEAALAVVQTLEPAGIAARNLTECLALQLKARNRFDPAIEIVLSNLDRLADRDFTALKRLTGLGEADLLDALTDIRACDPKPGTAFSGEETATIHADVHITQNAAGEWDIRLDDETLPKVLIDHTYATTLSPEGNGAAAKEARNFTQGLMDEANWLTRSLDQRARTILTVVTEIARQQTAFLHHGVQQLRPLTLQQVADAIGMHESTVSRVTSNKYVATPRGLFELKFFFTSTINAASGEAHSSQSVKEHIRALIAAETPKGVYSDDGLVEALRAENIDIARRTVAKYREAMQIPSSVQRKREKRAAAKAASQETVEAA
jgi:RNA polymerase sigma-54 factor